MSGGISGGARQPASRSVQATPHWRSVSRTKAASVPLVSSVARTWTEGCVVMFFVAPPMNVVGRRELVPAGPTLRIADSRAAEDEIVEAVGRLVHRPGDAAEQEQTEERIVEGPGVVAENGDEDAALARLIRPEERARLVFFLLRGEDGDLAHVAGQIPVALVDELALRDTSDDRVLRIGGELQIERAMAEFRARLPGKTDAGCQLFGGTLTVDGEVQQYEAATAG